ncbi:MAG: NADP oxidoreductase [Rhodobacteraceae bacterium]|jgi:pyrroline-5-carboxylate reductase|nr:NADP oxidoreductase [Paracoccaceae bacterium]
MTGRIGILGGTGWLGQALGLALLRGGIVAPGDLVILNRSGAAPGYADFPGVTLVRDMAALQAQAGPLVLSVRPEDFPVPGFAPGARLLISFMAAIPMGRLQALAPDARIVRAMPNGGASTGRSYSPWFAGGDLPAGDIALTRRLLAAIGTEDRVDSEDHLDILSALSGSGPGYPALMAQAMHAKALALGLPPAIAERAVEAVVAGSAAGLAGGVPGAGEIVAALKSYRGITAAGLDAAEAAGFSRALDAALDAAVATARRLGRED